MIPVLLPDYGLLFGNPKQLFVCLVFSPVLFTSSSIISLIGFTWYTPISSNSPTVTVILCFLVWANLFDSGSLGLGYLLFLLSGSEYSGFWILACGLGLWFGLLEDNSDCDSSVWILLLTRTDGQTRLHEAGNPFGGFPLTIKNWFNTRSLIHWAHGPGTMVVVFSPGPSWALPGEWEVWQLLLPGFFSSVVLPLTTFFN